MLYLCECLYIHIYIYIQKKCRRRRLRLPEFGILPQSKNASKVLAKKNGFSHDGFS
jgi:hypothetical protein